MIRYLRPFLTVVVGLGVLLMSTYLVIAKLLDASAWFSSWMQAVTMMVGFYFAERAQQKRSGEEK